MRRRLIFHLWLSAISLTGLLNIVAGGGGLNVALIVNETSPDSIQLGNYFAERRHIPPQNVIRIHWLGGRTNWSLADFETFLFAPLTNALVMRSLTGQIDRVVLSMDIPYKVTGSSGANSTTSVLFYGFKPDEDAGPTQPDSCSLSDVSTNDYAGSEMPFRSFGSGTFSNTFLTTMLTASNIALVERMVDQGVDGDETQPLQPVLLPKTVDVLRNVRFYAFDNAVFNCRLLGRPAILRTNLNSLVGLTNLLGWQHGIRKFTISSSNTFAPGAMADNLTSFGGAMFVPNDQTTIHEFIEAGVAGTYGTIVEPCAYLEKNPSPLNYFYLGRGFSLAECYYQSITNPYQGLLVGEPLSAPFRRSASGHWHNLPDGSVLAGITNLSLSFNAFDQVHPIQRIDLFVDGKFDHTLTNIVPRKFNTLHVSVNNHPMSYTVPDNASLTSIATGLAAVLNQPGNQSETGVRAFIHGDRIELQSVEPTSEGMSVPVTVNSTIGAAPVLSTFISASQPEMLDSSAQGLRAWSVTSTNPAMASLQLIVSKANGQQITIATTNGSSTLAALVQQIMDGVNATNALQGIDGLIAEDLVDQGGEVDFNLRVRSPGILAAQIQAQLTAMTSSVVMPKDNLRIDENVSDLRPRNHLYLATGTTNVSIDFAFDTAARSEGWHQLTAVAYEGTDVRTQSQIDQKVLIRNSALSATTTAFPAGSEIAVEATIQIDVAANTNTVVTTELFSTGGSLGIVTNQEAARFNVSGEYLGPGLHPFYALVTTIDGFRYRTETIYLRLLELEQPFPLAQSAPPMGITWHAVGGRSYDVFSTDDLAHEFEYRQSVVPTRGGPFQWNDLSPASGQRFYQVRTTP